MWLKKPSLNSKDIPIRHHSVHFLQEMRAEQSRQSRPLSPILISMNQLKMSSQPPVATRKHTLTLPPSPSPLLSWSVAESLLCILFLLQRWLHFISCCERSAGGDFSWLSFCLFSSDEPAGLLKKSLEIHHGKSSPSNPKPILQSNEGGVSPIPNFKPSCCTAKSN